MGVAAALAAGCGQPVPLGAPGDWPATREGMLFCYRSRDDVLAVDEDGRRMPLYAEGPQGLSPRGFAMLGRHDVLELRRGAYEAQQVGEILSAAVRGSGEVTFEAYVWPDGLEGAAAEIVSLTAAAGGECFAILQHGDRLVLRLGTGTGTGTEALQLFRLRSREPFHLLVAWRAGALACYRDGQCVLRHRRTLPDPKTWPAGRLIFGASADGRRDWSGTLEGIAIYSRALSAEEAQAEHAAFAGRLRARPQVAASRVRARLLAKSPVDPPEARDPYFRALTACRWRVERVLAGRCDADEIVVVHWAVLRNTPLAFGRVPLGSVYELTLEPWESRPDLEPVHIANALGVEALELPWYFDACGLAVTHAPPNE